MDSSGEVVSASCKCLAGAGPKASISPHYVMHLKSTAASKQWRGANEPPFEADNSDLK